MYVVVCDALWSKDPFRDSLQNVSDAKWQMPISWREIPFWHSLSDFQNGQTFQAPPDASPCQLRSGANRSRPAQSSIRNCLNRYPTLRADGPHRHRWGRGALGVANLDLRNTPGLWRSGRYRRDHTVHDGHRRTHLASNGGQTSVERDPSTHRTAPQARRIRSEATCANAGHDYRGKGDGIDRNRLGFGTSPC